MKNRRLQIAIFLACISCIPGPILGQQQKKSRLSVGLGLVASQRPQTGIDDEVTPVPVLLYERGGFYFRGIQVGYRWLRQSPFYVEVCAEPRLFEAYDDGDSDFLEGMDDRDPSFDVGVGFGWTRKHLEVRLSGSTDVIDSGDGSRIGLELNFPLQAGKWRLTPGTAAVRLSDEVVDYYYGVRPTEATLLRPAYRGQSTINFEASLLALRSINDHWAVFGRGFVQSLGSEIDDSPIVDTDIASGLLIGAAYTF